MSEAESIPVVVDKSHLITIGEKLYTESVELIRELVNNAYDADAQHVQVWVKDDEIAVEDDGSGMDLDGLKQYLTIGSPFKKTQRESPRFARVRIGEFGIGKFSALSASDHFEIRTRRGPFAATVVFDRAEWEGSESRWSLPLHVEPNPGEGPDGTRVVLRRLRRKFDLALVERRLQESVPLKAPQFRVSLNGKHVLPRYVAGRRIPFLEGTSFGVVHGEIVLAPEIREDPSLAGVECKVKGVTVRRSFFGLEGEFGASAAQMTGEVNADFLPVTSDRSGFIEDSPEYHAFQDVMRGVLRRVQGEMSTLKDEKENRRVQRALKEVVGKIQEALAMNMEWCPPGFLPQASASRPTPPEGASTQPPAPKTSPPKTRKRKFKLKPLTPSALVKRLKIGKQGLALIMDHFGETGPESFVQGEIIHVNRDHPLYKREADNRERHIMHVGRLIAQEIALMSGPRNPRQAFERQSKLLSDAFARPT